MNQAAMEFLIEKSGDLLTAPTCSEEAKEAAWAWLDAVGTPEEPAQTRAYLAELEEDIVTVDGLIAFAQSPAGAQVFGDKAPQVAAHAQEIKAAGARYCDCPACAVVEAILNRKAELLG